MAGSSIDYKTYIVSAEWRGKHKDFLKRSRYRCAFFPRIKCGKGARYNVHHMSYINLGSERLWIDVIVVCPFVHNFIFHGLLSGFRRPSQQRNYPNAAQRLAHFWCCQPVMVRVVLVVLLLVNLGKMLWLSS
jgi:hypothetical protein